MDIKDIISKVDHTLLSQTATESEIIALCNDGIKYSVASVCIPPAYVKLANYVCNGKIKVCTVIGFPNGYSDVSVKAFETEKAIADGADEIDMVINLGFVKDGKYNDILNEINAVKKCCNGKVLKVIIETCLLNDEEKIRLCDVVSNSDADFIKTSTGFSTGGATRKDIALFKQNIRGKFIKAAGGISTIKDAEDFLNLGADRLGTSRIIKIAKENNLI